MKKIFNVFFAFAMTVLLGGTALASVPAVAEEPVVEDTVAYTVECSDEENLATNKHNWLAPTLNSAEFTVDETEGMKFNNFIKDQQCVTYFRGGNFSEFKLSLLVNANLNIPAEGKAQWRYSEFYITFLIDRAPEDAVAEDGKPWYANKVYGSFCFGLTSGGLPISRFMYYDAFASNCNTSGQHYQPSGYTDTNVVDGKDHWIEIEVKNYDNNGVTGKKWLAYIDGVKVAEFDRDDDYYYDVDTKREYEVSYSTISGGIGMYANSDWPGGYSPTKMNNFVDIKKAKLISYDEDPNGKVVEQCQAPVFKVTSKEYMVAASYETGEPIEIQLSDLFNYEGADPINYEITCNGEPIGEVVNGFWAWTPTAAGSYDIDFKASIAEDNTAVNYLTIRVVGDVPTQSDGDGQNTEESGKGEESKGCGSMIGSGMLSLTLLAGAVIVCKRRK